MSLYCFTAHENFFMVVRISVLSEARVFITGSHYHTNAVCTGKAGEYQALSYRKVDLAYHPRLFYATVRFKM